jgi:hypothetical protein
MDTSLFLTEQVTSIVVRHLPNRSPAEIEALLKQFGATDVRVMSSTAMVSRCVSTNENILLSDKSVVLLLLVFLIKPQLHKH